MSNHHFVSYSVADAREFALKLYIELIDEPLSVPAWIDKKEIKPGQDWDKQIVEAIRTCRSLIFVMTPDSVEDVSICKNEWTRALKYKKPIIPILLHQDVEVPFQLGSRQYIDFTGEFETALVKLKKHIRWLYSSEGKLQALKDRLADANRDLRRTEDSGQRTRITNETESLKQQIFELEQIVKDPEGAKERVEKSISTGMERERQPIKPTDGVTRTKFINPPPGVAPTYWQNRHYESELIGKFLENEVECLLTIVGRAGVGKTALACRLLKFLESGRLPRDVDGLTESKELKVDGIIYLSERGSRKVSFPDIFFDLCRLLTKEDTQKLSEIYKDATISTVEKMKCLLGFFPIGRFVVLLDNFEDKMSTETLNVEDEDVYNALVAVLKSEPHAVKFILTTRIAPRNLALFEPAKQRRFDLDEGLGSPYAENILREMDTDGKIGLKEASDELLNKARERTNGYPRALEALFAILSADRDTSLSDILADTDNLLPEHVVEKMVGEAYDRLDGNAQMVMQALAIYGRPVSNVALDYLLKPYLEGIDSAKVLNRLVHMHFIRKETTQYYLHPVDRDYALSRIPKGGQGDKFIVMLLAMTQSDNSVGQAIFSRYALLERAAQYFKKIRLPREDWNSLADLTPQLNEFDLRCQSNDYDTAAGILLEIDNNYLTRWGHARLVLELYQRLEGKIENNNLRMVSLSRLGSCFSHLGDIRKAIEYHKQSLDICRKVGNRQNEGAILNNIGNFYLTHGDYQKAHEYFDQSLHIAQETGDRRSERFVLASLGIWYRHLGDYQKASEFHQNALEIAIELGDTAAEGSSLNNLGMCYRYLGEYQKAIEHFRLSLDINRKLGSRRSEGTSLDNLGLCYNGMGDYNRAIEYHQQSLDIKREIEYYQGEGYSLKNLGCALLCLGEKELATAHLRTAAEIWDKTGSPDVVEAYTVLGIALLRSNHGTETKESFEKALNRADAILDKTDRGETIDYKGLALCGLAICGDDKIYANKAKEAFGQARALSSAKGLVDRILKFYDLIADMDKNKLLDGVREKAGAAKK